MPSIYCSDCIPELLDLDQSVFEKFITVGILLFITFLQSHYKEGASLRIWYP